MGARQPGRIRKNTSRLAQLGRRLLPRRVRQRHTFRSRLMAQLAKELRKPNFFERLPLLEPTNMTHIRVWEFGGKKVVIKQTMKGSWHGWEYEKLRSAMLVHQRAVHDGVITPVHYRVRSIPIYGRHGDYLAMACIEGISLRRKLDHLLASHRKTEFEEFSQAYKELAKNTRRLGISGEFPQIIDAVVNPKRTTLGKDGVIYLYPPYDQG